MPVRCRRRPAASSASWKRLSISLLALILSASTTAAAPPPPPSPPPRYSARIIPTKSGQIRGILQDLSSPHLEPVEVFRGVPYAAPPQGELRFRPPLPATEWKEDPKLADKFGRVCPQNFPDLSNESIALQDMPQSRYNQLLKFANYLTNQSEDCLFLNLYIPGSGARGLEAPYAVIVYIHGESFEWGTGNIYDGSVLASAGHVIVITMNYRLGILGFLRTKPIITESAESFVSGNLAIHDIAMGLTWVRENIAAFGGDPTRVTLIGHDTGAALVNYLLLAPFGKGLFHKVVLLSGSALSPWASLHDPNDLRVRVAKQLDCTYQNDEDIAECLRTKSLEDLIQVELNEIKFMPKVGPSVPVDKSFPDPGLDMERLSDAFIKVPMILGVCTAESVLDFNADDIQYGFEEEQRNRVLRTFIRNAYVYHLNEILSAVRNEYTDWDKPVLHPVNIREATMEALSDGQTVAPLMRIAFYHARRGANTYFFHFSYQTKDSDYSLRLGSVRGDDIPYLFGLPLISGGQFFPKNYTRSDQSLAEVVLTFFTNFAKTGNPNEPHNIESVDYGNVKEKKRFSGLIWEKYETSTQQYLQIALKPKMKNHYRGHKMAVWLNLIPQLHQPGDEVSMSHHHFRESGEVFYAGAVRDEWYTPLIPNLLSTSTSTTTVCSTDEDMPGDTQSVHEPADETKDNSELLQRIASRHYYSTTTALAITVGVGCFLLVLNMLIFAGIYYQRDRSKKRDVSGVPPGGTMLHHVSNGQHSQSRQQSPSLSIAGTSRLYQPRAAQQEMPSNYTTLPKMVSSIQNDHLVGSSVMTMDRKKDINPPQPPQRTTSSLSTGATLKKRVQIQEITV